MKSGARDHGEFFDQTEAPRSDLEWSNWKADWLRLDEGWSSENE